MSKAIAAKEPKTINDPIVVAPVSSDTNPLFKKIFFGSLILMLGILWISGYNSGFSSDEMDMSIYGKANIAYYSSGGKDTTFLSPDHHDGSKLAPTLPFYGSGFEYFATGITSLIGDHYEYNTRHILNQFLAILGLLFTGLIAKRASNYKAATLSIWLTFLTPIFFGLSVFDTKDIPFLTTYIASIYFTISFFDQLPKPSWKTAFGLCFWLWFLLSIRLGGILMLGFIGLYAFLQYWKDKTILSTIKSWGTRLVITIGAAFTLMILTWPFVLRNPAENIMKSLNALKNFPQKILLTFDGEFIDSLNLPKNYLPKVFSVTIPLAILIALTIGFFAVVFLWKRIQSKNILVLLAVTGFFPAFYAIYSSMPLYNTWRHLLFIYPSVVILCSVGFIAALELISKPAMQLIPIGLLALGLIKPVKWCIENNPYQYAYFNELEGGSKHAYYEYETDYWQITVKEAIDWLVKNERAFSQSKDTQLISTNAYTFANYYFKHKYPQLKVKLEPLGEKSSYGAAGTYTIFNSLFLEPQYLENCFPSPFTYHSIDIDGMPATYISKDTLKYLYKGYEAFQHTNYQRADSFINLYLKQIKFDPNSPKNLTPVFGLISFTKLAVSQPALALKYAQLCLKSYPHDYVSNMTLGILFMDAKDYKKARFFLETAQALKPSEGAAQTYLNLLPK